MRHRAAQTLRAITVEGDCMGGFLKGLGVGLASFVAGFAALSVMFPPEPTAPAPGSEVRATEDMPGNAADVVVDPGDAGPMTAPVPEETIADASADDAATPTEPVGGDVGDESDAIATQDNGAGGDEPTAGATVEEASADSSPDASVQAMPAAEPVDTVEPAAPASDGGFSEAGTAATEAHQSVTAMTPDAERSDAAVQDIAMSDAGNPSVAEVAPATPDAGATDAEAFDIAALEPDASDGADVSDTNAPDTTNLESPSPETDTPAILLPEGATERAETTDPQAPTVPASPVLADAGQAPAPEQSGIEPSAPAPRVPETPGAPAPSVPVMRAVPPATPAPGLGRAVEGVVVGRLPTIGDAVPAPSPADAAVDEPPLAEVEGLPAWRRYAVPHDNPAGLPLFAVVVLDTAPDPATEAALVGLPFTVSVALDPADADAPRRAAAYRAAGHEVLIIGTGVPELATPSDLEVTFDGWSRLLPEAVALIDPTEGGIQANRQLAQGLMPFLVDRGLGLVTIERGLNPAQQSARRAGVVSAGVFRVIDSGDESAPTIRRYLDRATFRAQQEGKVAVIGHAGHAPTLEALLAWRMEGRAGQVSLAPVSALLSAQ